MDTLHRPKLTLRHLLPLLNALYWLSLLALAFGAVGKQGSADPAGGHKQTRTLPPMSRRQWLDLPEEVRYFLPWSAARRPQLVTIATDKLACHEQSK